MRTMILKLSMDLTDWLFCDNLFTSESPTLFPSLLPVPLPEKILAIYLWSSGS